ncbi:hypothetical protein REPUB_Repub14bG0017100 [Reevesia pubescens]
MYTISSHQRSVAAWLSPKKQRSLRKDKNYMERVELIQDLRFETATSKIKITPDGEFLIASGRHRSGAWSLELSIWSVDDGRFEGEFGGARDWEHRGVASKIYRYSEGALPQLDRSASKCRRYTMQTHRRQPSRPGDGSWCVIFFASQRTRVRKQVRLSREKALRSNACKETEEGVVPIGSDATIPVEPVPLNSVIPINAEEAPSCSTQDDALTGIDELDKHFVENIFNKMRKEETFSRQLLKNKLVFSLLSSRFSDISNRARLLISRWSKMFARSQAAKKPNGLRSSTEAQNEMLLKQSISEIMGDESWQSNIDNSEGVLAISNVRKLESPQVLKLLPASMNDSKKKNILGASGSHSRERSKVQLVEQPGQKMAGKSSQTTRTVPINQSRPLSADDIQKAKMRALYMQSKHGKTGFSNGMNETKSEGLNKPSTSQASFSPPVSKVPSRPAEEPKKPVIPPLKTSNRLETSFDPKQTMDSKESPWEKCQKVKIPWHTPPEVKLNDHWRVGAGDAI